MARDFFASRPFEMFRLTDFSWLSLCKFTRFVSSDIYSTPRLFTNDGPAELMDGTYSSCTASLTLLLSYFTYPFNILVLCVTYFLSFDDFNESLAICILIVGVKLAFGFSKWSSNLVS